MRVAGTASVAANQGIATATRRTSVRMVVTPGADHVVAGGVAARACTCVSNRRKLKPWRSTGSTQYPATNPGAAGYWVDPVDRSIRRRTLVPPALLARS